MKFVEISLENAVLNCRKICDSWNILEFIIVNSFGGRFDVYQGHLRKMVRVIHPPFGGI